jgi:hypothetical protein
VTIGDIDIHLIPVELSITKHFEKSSTESATCATKSQIKLSERFCTL